MITTKFEPAEKTIFQKSFKIKKKLHCFPVIISKQ